VRVRYPRDERESLQDVRSSRIRTPAGDEVPLGAVADFEFAEGYAAISGTNGMRRLVVYGQTDKSITNPDQVNTDLRENGFLDRLVAGYPGMEWRARGEAEEQAETLGGLGRGFMMALLGVFVIMAAMFRSYVQPLVILLIIPYGLVGAVVGHWILDINITMLSLFGIVALSGVVVNDAIVLVECVNAHLARGESFYKAVELGGVRRFRAIFLTTVSTCVGLVPILSEQDLAAQFVIPMCASVAFGVAFATLITLVLLPCYLGILNDLRRLVYYLRKGESATPEEVEPAKHRHRHLIEFEEEPAMEPVVAPTS